MSSDSKMSINHIDLLKEVFIKTNVVDCSNSTIHQPVKKQSNRCHSCNKKTGLTGFVCKCKNNFCSEHRHAESHSCDFDYKADGLKILNHINIKCVADKVDKI